MRLHKSTLYLMFFFAIVIAGSAIGTLITNGYNSPFSQYGENPDTHNPVFENAATHTWSTRILGMPIYEDSFDPHDHLVFVDSMMQDKNASSGYLYALNDADGSVRWSIGLPNQVMDTPIVADGMVYIGFGNASFPPMSQRALVDDYYPRGTGISGVVAVNEEDGKVVWESITKGEVMPTLTFHNGVVYVVTGNRYLDGWNAITGTEVLHQWVAGYDSMSGATYTNGHLYFPTMYPPGFVSYDLQNHSIQWMTHKNQWSGGQTDANPLVAFGSVWVSGMYVPLSDTYITFQQYLRNDLIRINQNTGAIQEDILLDKGKRTVGVEAGQFTEANHTIFLTSPLAKAIYAFNPSSNQIIWRDDVGDVKGGALVYGNDLFLLNGGNTLWIINSQNGNIIKKVIFKNTSFSISTPIMIGKSLVFSSTLEQCQDHICGKVFSIPISHLIG